MLNNNEQEEGALRVHKLTFWEAAMIIVGANVGAGILGLPYSAHKAGWPILFLWLIISGIFVTASMLCVAETSLRTKEVFQLPGLAQKYVGPLGSWLVFFSVVANSVGCMISYMAGSGPIIASFLGVSSQTGSLIFAIPAVLIVWFGLKVTGVAEKIITFGLIFMMGVIIIASFIAPQFDLSNALFAKWKFAVPMFNVALFCYIAQYTVPELARGLRHDPKKLAPAIATGMFITFILLALVPLAVLGLTGADNVTEVATLAWGNTLGSWAFYFANIVALLAMMTSYWAVAGSMLTNIVDKFNLKSEWDIKTRLIIIFIIAVPPFILAYSGVVSFVDAIFLAGTFGGIIMSIIPVLMIKSARKNGDREPEWTGGFMTSNIMQFLLIVIFCAAGIYSIASLFGLLPKGW